MRRGALPGRGSGGRSGPGEVGARRAVPWLRTMDGAASPGDGAGPVEVD